MDEILELFADVVWRLYHKHADALERLAPAMKARIKMYLDDIGSCSKSESAFAPSRLVECLHQVHGKKCIVLIDEYDHPMFDHSMFDSPKCHDETLSFFNMVF